MADTSDIAVGASARRVQRSFAFLDLSGFTALTERDGDRRAVDVLALFRRAVRDGAGSNGVRVGKWLGDGAMLVAIETPPLIQAVHDVIRRLEALGCPLPLRGGVCAGGVILFEGDDYIGRAVNLSSRLCDRAGDHQVLAPFDLLPEITEQGLETRSVEIRGFTEPIEVVNLTETEARESATRTS